MKVSQAQWPTTEKRILVPWHGANRSCTIPTKLAAFRQYSLTHSGTHLIFWVERRTVRVRIFAQDYIPVNAATSSTVSVKCGKRLETSVHGKFKNTGLLRYYHSHVDKRYERCLLSTMINRAYRLSSTPTAFSEELDKLRTTFLNLDHPVNLINSSINEFLFTIDNISAPEEASDGTSNIVVPLTSKDQKSPNSVKREMQNLSAKIGVQIKPVFQSQKISQVLSRSSPL